MGTWDIDPFGNDTACDWAYMLEETGDLSLLESTIENVLAAGDEYLEAYEAEEALAAVEVIARLLGHWGTRNAYTEPVDLWVERYRLKPSPDLLRRAEAAIDRILTTPSELLELWEDSDDGEAWKQSVHELKTRVHG